MPDGCASYGVAVPTLDHLFEGHPDEAALKTPTRALIRNLRMLNRHLGELRGEVWMVVGLMAIERNETVKAKGWG